jgi:hypothetical protein
MSSPNFAGTASITSTNGTINLGPGTGTLSVGGKPLNPDDEATLDGYDGTMSVAANGDGTDSVSLGGTADNVLQVSGSPATLTTDQNTPITFQTNVETSLADTYNLTVNAPAGWTVSIDSKGNVTATPAPGLQSGTYPIQIIVQSQTDPNLEAQTTVDVTITATQPGINFGVVSDPLFTVPYDGAQLPTAFRAVIQNLGPAADTYNLTFSNVPSGFTLLNSGTSVTIPAGQTGIVGIYLQPNTGQTLSAPGTVLPFTVKATSTTNSAITKTQTVTFTVPAIDAVTVTGNPTSLGTTPGTGVADTLTFSNVGNVPETVALTDTLQTGLSASALTPLTLAVGQTLTETVTLTPASSTPLNTLLQATFTATYGPNGSPQTQTLTGPRAGRRPRRPGRLQRGRRRRPGRKYRAGQPAERPQHRTDDPVPEPDGPGRQGAGDGQPGQPHQPRHQRPVPRLLRPRDDHRTRGDRRSGVGRRRPDRADQPRHRAGSARAGHHR